MTRLLRSSSHERNHVSDFSDYAQTFVVRASNAYKVLVENLEGRWWETWVLLGLKTYCPLKLCGKCGPLVETGQDGV